MPGKRKDQRILIDDHLASLVLKTSLGEPLAEEVERTRTRLSELLDQAAEQLNETDLQAYQDLAKKQAGRRGSVRFELDPDGAVVLVVSYGGSATPALSRDTFKARGWNKREEQTAPPPPPKGRGFIKTSPSVTPPTVVENGPSDMFEDDLARLFDEPVPAPEPMPVSKTRKKPRKLTSLSGPSMSLSKDKNPLEQAQNEAVDLRSILKDD